MEFCIDCAQERHVTDNRCEECTDARQQAFVWTQQAKKKKERDRDVMTLFRVMFAISYVLALVVILISGEPWMTIPLMFVMAFPMAAMFTIGGAYLLVLGYAIGSWCR